jgi:hypothetical protein
MTEFMVRVLYRDSHLLLVEAMAEFMVRVLYRDSHLLLGLKRWQSSWLGCCIRGMASGYIPVALIEAQHACVRSNNILLLGVLFSDKCSPYIQELH